MKSRGVKYGRVCPDMLFALIDDAHNMDTFAGDDGSLDPEVAYQMNVPVTMAQDETGSTNTTLDDIIIATGANATTTRKALSSLRYVAEADAGLFDINTETAQNALKRLKHQRDYFRKKHGNNPDMYHNINVAEFFAGDDGYPKLNNIITPYMTAQQLENHLKTTLHIRPEERAQHTHRLNNILLAGEIARRVEYDKKHGTNTHSAYMKSLGHYSIILHEDSYLQAMLSRWKDQDITLRGKHLEKATLLGKDVVAKMPPHVLRQYNDDLVLMQSDLENVEGTRQWKEVEILESLEKMQQLEPNLRHAIQGRLLVYNKNQPVQKQQRRNEFQMVMAARAATSVLDTMPPAIQRAFRACQPSPTPPTPSPTGRGNSSPCDTVYRANAL